MFRQYLDSQNSESWEFCTKIAYISEINEWDNRAHLERIRKYSSILLRSLSLSKDRQEQMSLACMLHDVGKIMTPSHLLQSKDKYNPSEWQIVEHHTIDGAILLRDSRSPILQMAASIARSHHERWDGSGYPDGLKAEEIPVPARICAIADVFDALTTDRFYKKHLNLDEAFNFFFKTFNVLVDPNLIDLFERNFDEFRKIQSTSNE